MKAININKDDLNNSKFLYEKVLDYLLNLIKQNNQVDDFKLPSENELADSFKVSRITIKKAISELQKQGLVYSKQGKGTFVSKTHTDTKMIPIQNDRNTIKSVGLILPDFKSNYVLSIIESIESYLRELNISLLVSVSNYSQDMEKKIVNSFLNNNVSGIIIYPVDGELYNEDLLKLAINKFPLVFIDRKLQGINVCYVHSDNYDSSYNAIKYLISKGHKEIGLLSTNPDNTSTIEDRVNGYKQALKDNNIKINPNYFLTNLSNYDQDWTNKIKNFITTNKNMTALFATNSDLGIKVHLISKQLNLKIPSDLEVIYYDHLDEHLLPLFSSNHTYIKQDLQQLGKTAAELLISIINNKDVTKREFKIASSLIINDKPTIK